LRTARAEVTVPLSPPEAAELWRDTGRWGSFVEGLQGIERVSPDWPAEGATAVWRSGPAGRGRVTEKVLETGERRFATRVFEQRLSGVQRASFEEAEGGALVRVELEYELARRGPLGALADLLFIGRALRDSLRRTLIRFAVEAEEEAGLR
jgi:hypothetical protein